MKKIPSQRFIPQLALKLAAKPSDMVELFGVSRNYLFKLSTGQRPLTGRMLEKVAAFAIKDAAFKAANLQLRRLTDNFKPIRHQLLLSEKLRYSIRKSMTSSRH
jgi:hypothetical protein